MDDAVFRGMPVDAAPLRLRRSPAALVISDEEDSARARAELAYREAVSAGFDEGLQRGQREGRQAGYEEGRRSGRDEAQRHAAEIVETAVATATAELMDERARLQEVLRGWEDLFADVSSHAEDEMVALCYETICRVVGAVALHPDSVRAALVQAVAAAREEPRVLLLVHPDDVALLDRADLPSLPGQALSWRGDPSVASGGCVVKGNAGGLDLRLETLLAGCKAALLLAREARLEHEAVAREATR